jgi:hypothetical protein
MPAQPRQGNRYSDHREIMDEVFHRTRTGTPWRSATSVTGTPA